MFKPKSLAGILLVLAVLFAQVGTVLAAPAAQDDTTPITGTVKTLSTETDSNGVTTVLVTVEDDMGGTQTVRISAQTAEDLGLATYDETTNEVVLVDPLTLVDPVTIDPTVVIVDEEPTDEAVHPIAAILASFFGEDPAVVNQYHEDGYGFGVIAQAMWIAQGLEENDSSIDAGMILQAKRDKDFDDFILPDGSTPTNWGQFKNAATGKDKKNLGIIVSGHAENEDGTADLTTQQNHGNNKDKNKDKDKGNGNGNSNKP